MPTRRYREALLDALEALAGAIRENEERDRIIVDRIAGYRIVVMTGESLADRLRAVTAAGQQPVPLMVTANLRALSEASVRFRRVVARVLVEEGMSVDEVATAFGVSRQRISKLLRDGDGLDSES